MARETAAQLRARIEQLEAENEALKENVTEAAPRARKRSWAWTLLATVLIVIGALLSPVALVGSWVNLTLTDTDRFVATYGPLASDPSVQKFVADETVNAINEQLDIPGLTSSVIDGIIDLGTGPVATRALETLKGPAASGVQGLIESGVDKFVASDAFANVWTQTLRISHTQLVNSMQGTNDGALTISDRGEIGIQLAPIIAQVKIALIDQGLTFASQIPEIDRTIVIAQSDAIPTIQLAYSAAVVAGYWLAVIALVFLAAGVLVARRRALALIWAAVALALGMVITLAGLGAGNLVFISTLTPFVLPVSVANVLFAAVAAPIQSSATAVLVLAIVVAIVAWLAGPFSVPRKLRSFGQSGAASIREAAEKRGLSTGRTGEWMYRQRVLLRVVVAVAATAVLFFSRPVSVALVLWTLVISVIVVALLEVLQRPVTTVPEPAEVETA